MSTKIENAYILDKNYSLYELGKIIEPLRNRFRNAFNQDISDRVLKYFLTFFNYVEFCGEENIRRQIRNDYDLDFHHKQVLEAILNKNWHEALFCIRLKLSQDIKRASDMLFDENNYKCILQIYPLKDKILVLYLGRDDYVKYVKENEHFIDYSYQNQTDKPDDVSEEEWNQRESDWDEVLGAEGFVMNHGFTIYLTDEKFIHMFRSFTDYEVNLPDKKSAVNDVLYSLPEEAIDRPYKKWADKTKQEILAKCTFFDDKDEFLEYFGLTKDRSKRTWA